jgi:hypothetical protein
VVFGWEFHIAIGERLFAVQFAGAAIDERWFAVGCGRRCTELGSLTSGGASTTST